MALHSMTKCSSDAKYGIHQSWEKLSHQLLLRVRLRSVSVRLKQRENLSAFQRALLQNKDTNLLHVDHSKALLYTRTGA